MAQLPLRAGQKPNRLPRCCCGGGGERVDCWRNPTQKRRSLHSSQSGVRASEPRPGMMCTHTPTDVTNDTTNNELNADEFHDTNVNQSGLPPLPLSLSPARPRARVTLKPPALTPLPPNPTRTHARRTAHCDLATPPDQCAPVSWCQPPNTPSRRPVNAVSAHPPKPHRHGRVGTPAGMAVRATAHRRITRTWRCRSRPSSRRCSHTTP